MVLHMFLEEDETADKILDGLDFTWSTGDIEMGVFRNRFRIAEKLTLAAENPLTNFSLRPNNQQLHGTMAVPIQHLIWIRTLIYGQA